jgi:hypothetical protein
LGDKIEYRKDKAAKESSPEALAEKKQKQKKDFLKSINGATYVRNWSDPSGWATTDKIEIKNGETLSMMLMRSAPAGLPLAGNGDWYNKKRGIIQGRKFVIDGGTAAHLQLARTETK